VITCGGTLFGLLGAVPVFTRLPAAITDTIRVLRHFPTIQAAIAAAANGDDIIVAPGTYREAVNVLGKAIHVQSSGSLRATALDATALDTSVVTCAAGEAPGEIIEGFAITEGAGPPERLHGGGMINGGSSPSLIDCTVSGNTATDFGEIQCEKAG